MATYAMFFRVSRSLLPLATRAVGSPRPFHGAISTAVSSGKGRLVTGASSLRFSTLMKTHADEALVQVLDPEIESAQEPDSQLRGVSFIEFRIILGKVPYHPSELENREETIKKIEGEDDVEEEDDEEENENENNNDIEVLRDHAYLELFVTGFPDKISIASVTILYPHPSDKGPPFNYDLNEEYEYFDVNVVDDKTNALLDTYEIDTESEKYRTLANTLEQFLRR